MRQLLLLSAVAIGWLGFASSAEAAKGVKKAKPNTTTQHVTGTVTRVTRGKQGAGTFTVAAAATKKKDQPAAAGVKAGMQSHVFTVAPGTTFHITHNGSSRAASFAVLAAGEHVTVSASNNLADKVSIQQHNIKKKTRHVRTTGVKRKLPGKR